MNLSTAVTRLKRLLQNQEINFDSTTDTLEDCVKEAVDKYSDDKPISLTTDITGNDTAIVDLPNAYTWDFSVISQVEYPVDDTSADKEYIDNDYWSTYRKPGGTIQLIFTDKTPASTEEIRVTFTKYVETISDVLVSDEKAILQLAGYFACLREAQKEYNTSNDGTGLGFVDHSTSASGRMDVGETFKRNYDDHIFGSTDKDARRPASIDYQQWITEDRWDETRLFHKDDT